MPFRIPHIDESLHIFGESLQKKITTPNLSWLIWNVYKGRRGLLFEKDMARLMAGKSFVLLQETMNNEMLGLLKQYNPEHHWKMATSFEYWHNRHRTGVATGSLVQAIRTQAVRTAKREFLFWTPKVTLISEYEIADTKETLLVINTHAINFATGSSFKSYLSEFAHLFNEHKGPIVLAGDFNTWSTTRFQVLVELTKKSSLIHVVFEEDQRVLKLDHIFWRGFAVESAAINCGIQSSDHFPLELKLRLLG